MGSFVVSLLSMLTWFYLYGIEYKDPLSIQSLILLLVTASTGIIPSAVSNTSSSTVLIPVVDSCNHDSNTPSCKILYNPVTAMLELSSMKAVTSGDEVNQSIK